MNKLITLNEDELKILVRESTKDVLNEISYKMKHAALLAAKNRYDKSTNHGTNYPVDRILKYDSYDDNHNQYSSDNYLSKYRYFQNNIDYNDIYKYYGFDKKRVEDIKAWKNCGMEKNYQWGKYIYRNYFLKEPNINSLINTSDLDAVDAKINELAQKNPYIEEPTEGEIIRYHKMIRDIYELEKGNQYYNHDTQQWINVDDNGAELGLGMKLPKREKQPEHFNFEKWNEYLANKNKPKEEPKEEPVEEPIEEPIANNKPSRIDRFKEKGRNFLNRFRR